MHIYNLDNKVTNKSNSLLSCYIESQKELDTSRINELRSKCRNILEKNGIFEDRKNSAVYIAMENEIKELEDNIAYFNKSNLEELTRAKTDACIENIELKLDSLEQNSEYESVQADYSLSREKSESSIRSMISSFYNNYKANTIELLLKKGYSQNTINDIEDDIASSLTTNDSDILTEKITQDGIKNITSLNDELDEVSKKIIEEAEVRYNCEISGEVYDELRDKRETVKKKALELQDLMRQIKSIDAKSRQVLNEK